MTIPRPHPLEQVEVRFGIAGGVLVLVLVLVRLAGLPDGYVFGLLLGTTSVLSAAVSRGLALVLGLTAWALCTGFVTNRYGVLTFGHRDLALMAELVLMAGLVSHLAGVARATLARAGTHEYADRVGAHEYAGQRLRVHGRAG